MSSEPNFRIVKPNDDHMDTDARLDAIETRQIEMFRMIAETNQNVMNLLAGLKQFLEFAESMKGHPLLAAFAPTPGKPKK